MVKKIGQIQRELAAIEARVAAVTEDLQALYEQYLVELSQITRKQLILVGYQICTQIYPRSFLALSLRQKEQVQAKLRELGEQIPPRLLSCLDPSEPTSEPNILEQMLDQTSNHEDEAEQTQAPERQKENSLGQQRHLATTHEALQAGDLPVDEELENALDLQQPLSEAELVRALSEIKVEEDEEDLSEEKLEPTDRIAGNPESSLRLHKQIEQKIRKTLENLSQEANDLLYKAQILPNELPVKIFKAAIQSEESSAPTGGAPNLLNLLVEAENQRSQKSAVAKVTAICLRLSELEFSAPSLSAQRRQIRQLVEQIKKMRQQYRQKHQESTVAQAEAAWRASWFEE